MLLLKGILVSAMLLYRHRLSCRHKWHFLMMCICNLLGENIAGTNVLNGFGHVFLDHFQ